MIETPAQPVLKTLLLNLIKILGLSEVALRSKELSLMSFPLNSIFLLNMSSTTYVQPPEEHTEAIKQIQAAYARICRKECEATLHQKLTKKHARQNRKLAMRQLGRDKKYQFNGLGESVTNAISAKIEKYITGRLSQKCTEIKTSLYDQLTEAKSHILFFSTVTAVQWLHRKPTWIDIGCEFLKLLNIVTKNKLADKSVEIVASITEFVSSVTSSTPAASIVGSTTLKDGDRTYTFNSFDEAPSLGICAGIATILGTALVGYKLPHHTNAFTAFKQYGQVGQAAFGIKRGFSTVWEVITQMTTFLQKFLVDWRDDFTISRHGNSLFAHAFDVKRFVRGVRDLTQPQGVDIAEVDTRDRYLALKNMADIYTRWIAEGHRLNPTIATLMTQHCRMLETFGTAHKAMLNAPLTGNRRTPFWIAITGEPGCGKSNVCKGLIQDLSHSRFLDLPVDVNNLFYSVNGRLSHMDRYNGQPWVLFDDQGQARGETVTESEALSLIHMVSSVEMVVPMASLDDKGKLFRSIGIVSTTNNVFAEPKEIRSRTALWRRRNVVLNVTAKGCTGICCSRLPPHKRMHFDFIDPLGGTKSDACTPVEPEKKIVKLDGQDLKNIGYLKALTIIGSQFKEWLASDTFDFKHEPLSDELIEEAMKSPITVQMNSLTYLVDGPEEEEPDTYSYRNICCVPGSSPFEDLRDEFEARRNSHISYCMRWRHLYNSESLTYKVVPASDWESLGFFKRLIVKEALDEGFIPIARPSQWTYPDSLYRQMRATDSIPNDSYAPVWNASWRQSFHDEEGWGFCNDSALKPILINENFNLYEFDADFGEHPITDYNFHHPFHSHVYNSMPDAFHHVHHFPDVPLQFNGASYSREPDPRQVSAAELELRHQVTPGHYDLFGDDNSETSEEPLPNPLDQLSDSQLHGEEWNWFDNVYGALGMLLVAASVFVVYKKMYQNHVERKEITSDENAARFKGLEVYIEKHFPGKEQFGAKAEMFAALQKVEENSMASGDPITQRYQHPRITATFNSFLEVMQTMTKIYSNEHNVNFLKKDTIGSTCLLGVYKKYALINTHALRRYGMNISITRNKQIYSMTLQEGVEITPDVTLIHLPGIPDFKDIRKYFIKESQLAFVQAGTGQITTHGVKGICHQIKYEMESEKTYDILKHDSPTEWEEHLLAKGFTYEVPNAPGSCGTPLINCGTNVPGPILGIHQVGGEMFGRSVLVTQEMLGRHGLEWNSLEEAFVSSETPPRISIPTGLDFIGTTKVLEQVPPPPTALRPSPIHGLFRTPITQPAVFSLRDTRVDPDVRDAGISPLQLGLAKFGTETLPLPKDALRVALAAVEEWHEQLTPSCLQKRLLDEYETLNGAGEVLNAINMETSPGLCWVKMCRKRGKRDLFDLLDVDARKCDPAAKTWKFADNYMGLALQQEFSQLEERLRADEDCPLIVYENLKDERRKIAKIRAAQTRTFDCSPIEFNLLFRKYFGAWMAMLQSNCVDSYSAVGINPGSYQWTQLYSRLRHNGADVIAGDYKNWDGQLQAHVMESACEAINAWYDDSEDNKRVRKRLIHSMIHSYIVTLNVITQKHQGIPSGVAITAPFNSLCNALYLFTAIASIHKDHHKCLPRCSDLLRNCSITCYGDDHIVAISPSWREFVNFKKVKHFFSKHKIVYTDAKKTDKDFEFESLDEIFYLKRQFVRDKQCSHLFQAPLDINDLCEQINWVRKSPFAHEALVYKQVLEGFELELARDRKSVV